jgi:hypothetical protein
MLVTCVLAVYVGVRTLWIFAFTRGVQELAIGLNVLSVAIGGAMLTIDGLTSPSTTPSYDSLSYRCAMGFLALHLLAIYLGTAMIFRAESRIVVRLSVAMIAPIGFWYFMAAEQAGTVWVRPVLFQALRGIGMTWSAFECFHYSDRLRRRASLGLADPLMAHRFWLWAIGATSALLVCTLELLVWGLSDVTFSALPLGLMLVAALGLVGSTSVALAFFPPASYVRFVRHRLDGAKPARRATDDEPG